MRLFNDNLEDMRGLPRISFKGGQTQTTTRNIPAQTTEEAALQGSATNYANSAMNTANTTLGNANQVAGNFGNMYNNYNTNAQNVTDRYMGLLNGELPQQYQQARQSVLNSDLVGTFGNAVNGLGSRGVINSSIMGGALNGINRNAADSLNRSFSSDMSNYAGILGNTAANNNNNLSNYNANLSSQIGNSGALAGNTSDLFNTMYNGRYGSAGQTTTTNDGGSGLMSAVGGIGSALITCFAGGTVISCPNGNKAIRDIKVGDSVYSLDENNEKCIETVTYVMPSHLSEILAVITNKRIVKTTNSQRFLTDKGFEYVEEITTPIITVNGYNDVLSISKLPAEKVYDFTVTGRNIFFANGLASEGID